MYGRQHEIEQSCNVELVVVAEEVARDDSDDVDGIDAGSAIDGLEDLLNHGSIRTRSGRASST